MQEATVLTRKPRPDLPMTIRDDLRVAKRDLKAFRAGATSPDGPTPERIVQAGLGYHKIQDFSEAAEVIGENGRPETITMERKRVRIAGHPLARLAERRLLAPHDKFRNDTLALAGERYYGLWYNGGMHPLGAMDPSKPFVSSSGAHAFFQSEWQIDQWRGWVAAREKIPSAFQTAVDNIVLYEWELLAIGKKISGYQGVKQATAVALDRVRLGLESVARHFGMFEQHSAKP